MNYLCASQNGLGLRVVINGLRCGLHRRNRTGSAALPMTALYTDFNCLLFRLLLLHFLLKMTFVFI